MHVLRMVYRMLIFSPYGLRRRYLKTNWFWTLFFSFIMSRFVLVLLKDGKIYACFIRYVIIRNCLILISTFLLVLYMLRNMVSQGTLSGSYNFGMLAISPEALSSFYQAKVQLLLILIEALNLESLLQMVHDEIPFRFLDGLYFLSLFSLQTINV